jgi:hypothetical protein
MVLPRSLDELTTQSDRIVHGNVVAAKVEPHPQYPGISTVVVTVRVQESLKGSSAKEFTFRQYIWDLRDKHDAAGYKKGQELLLFLNRPTDIGLVNPVGLDQGRLLVEHDATGRMVVHPKVGNMHFAKGLRAKLARVGAAPGASIRIAEKDSSVPMDLNEVKAAIRALTRGNK